jgi:hypothetical protein
MAVKETIGHEGLKALDESKILNYEESFVRLTKIEFEPADFETKPFPRGKR